MNRHLLYLIGGPGTGKSTLMRKLTAELTRVPINPGPERVARDGLFDGTGGMPAIELGVRRGAFSGTDALPSSVITRAVPWLTAQTEAPLILGEGARLGNARFLTAARDAGYRVTLGVLEHDQADEWRAIRSARLARLQDPAWVKGRFTAVRNLADNAPVGVHVLRGHPDDLIEPLFDISSLPRKAAA